MSKPNKNNWLSERLRIWKEKEQKALYDEYQSNKMAMREDIALTKYHNGIYNLGKQEKAKLAELNNLYDKIYAAEINSIENVSKKLVVSTQAKGIINYAKTRNKQANEMFNLNYLVKEKSPKQFERFVKATHGRTVKKMLMNNIKFAQSQGAKQWATNAMKFVKNFKGDKVELAFAFSEKYGDRLSQYSSDLSLKNPSGLVRESERLTKGGKIRKRYQKRTMTNTLTQMERTNKDRMMNIERAMYRMFKIDNRAKDFDVNGEGTITQYWLNRIKDFANIPRAGLADLEEQFFEYINLWGNIGGQLVYSVKLSERALKVLKRMNTQKDSATYHYARAFKELYKKDTKE